MNGIRSANGSLFPPEDTAAQNNAGGGHGAGPFVPSADGDHTAISRQLEILLLGLSDEQPTSHSAHNTPSNTAATAPAPQAPIHHHKAGSSSSSISAVMRGGVGENISHAAKSVHDGGPTADSNAAFVLSSPQPHPTVDNVLRAFHLLLYTQTAQLNSFYSHHTDMVNELREEIVSLRSQQEQSHNMLNNISAELKMSMVGVVTVLRLLINHLFV